MGSGGGEGESFLGGGLCQIENQEGVQGDT